MLDLVSQETERIESRFLEPACGTGNFLTEILERKLRIVESRYRGSQLDYERYAVLAVSSMYGIDILEDSVLECRSLLFHTFNREYSRLFQRAARDTVRETVRYLLSSNIIQGDALTLMTVEPQPKPIVFSEWSPVNGSMLKRRDYTFGGLLACTSQKEQPLLSDFGQRVFIPTPLKEFPVKHFLQVATLDK
ncbi:MAG: hypothetical protein QOD77_256 [Thermoplasmata archaeon]|nr:hypothetical protein [Thermoplasmata archaeon]